MELDNEDMLDDDMKENEPDFNSVAVISDAMKTSAKHGWDDVIINVSYKIFIGYLKIFDILWYDLK